MTKSPYELRFELLQFAQSTLSSQYYAELEQTKYIQSLINEGKVGNPDEVHNLNIPDYPTIEEIFDLADKYKAFIDQK
jgi:hypothetical protein